MNEEPDKYRNHLRAAEEMAEAHKEWMKCLKVMLEYHPEMEERTEPLSDQLREIFQHNDDAALHGKVQSDKQS